MTPVAVRAYRLSKSFAPTRLDLNRGEAARPVLRDVTLTLVQGEIVAILGPSGSGKSTLLKLLGGQLTPDSEQENLRPTVSVTPSGPPGLVYMPQESQLIRTRSVWSNVAIGAIAAGVERADLHERVQEALQMVRLHDRASELPGVLSGGMQQRAALARVLAARPRVLLLDEPLSSLDLPLRRFIAGGLRTYARVAGAAILLSTHTVEESVDLADRVLLLGGTPASICRSFGLGQPPAHVVADKLPHQSCESREVLLASVYDGLQRLDEPAEDQW